MPAPRVVLIVGLALLSSSFSIATTVEYDSNAIIINGERKLIFSGAIHYPRSTPEMWPDLINKAKEGGLDAIETYVFWDLHEPRRRQYDFSENIDFIRFFKLIQEAGLYAILRIGPYVCAEWNYGGFPVWLHNIQGIELRTDNEIYKNEMKIFTTKIVEMCKEAELFAPQGGPIIIAQIENEYGNVMKGYGEAGKEYIKWSAKMAIAQYIGVPWIMCQQNDAPKPIINTCNGFYCHRFTPNNPTSPKFFTENWSGWFKRWGGGDPRRTAEDLAYSVARFFQNGGVLNNYYMYHGGTNFGRTSGASFYATSYDYDAPIDEYGNLNQPKWGHLKQLHAAIKLGEKMLTNSKPRVEEYGTDVRLSTFVEEDTEERFCFLSNSNEKEDANVDLQDDGKFVVPAWSVSILQNCNTETYNTAKVTTPTERYSVYSADSPKLKWTWTPEPMQDTLLGKGTFTASKLLDQKEATVDKSDYLWYMTSININKDSWKKATLHVRTSGHILHAYVNQRLIGSKYYTKADNVQSVKGDDYGFVFEKPVPLKIGENTITLLSVTVGLPSYGEFFDKKPTGIVYGPVILFVDGNTFDLTSNVWSYRVGLHGEANKFYDPKSLHSNKWIFYDPKSLHSNKSTSSDSLPTSEPMTWYKASFEAPTGTLPVVLDLQGMGKGHAWVNGKSIGRYWPTQIADTNECSKTCDYRGPYNDHKCMTNCGNPSQRWYHVPRSFLNNNVENTLILFEEFGGDPSSVTTGIVKECPGKSACLVTQATFGVTNLGGNFTKETGSASTSNGLYSSIMLPSLQAESIGESLCF